MPPIDFVPRLKSPFDEDKLLEFYDKMKSTLVRISTTFEGMVMEFSGIYVNCEGHIFTIARMLPTTPTTIITIQSPDMIHAELATVVDRNDRMDLALIKSKESRENYDHVRFEDGHKINLGRNVLMLTNILQSPFTKQVGMISYNCNTQGDCKFTRDIVPDNHVLSRCIPKLALVETSGVHFDETSFGAPLFSMRGMLVGMHVFGTPNYEYYIHGDELQKYLEEYEKRLPKPKGSRNARKRSDGGVRRTTSTSGQQE